MRSSVLVLPLLLLVSPGDGTSPRRASPPPDEAWNPLRTWQRMEADSGDTTRRGATVPDKLPACPMPVAPLPAEAEVTPSKPTELPPGSFRAFWNSLHSESRPFMPIARSGCWNPLFKMRVGDTAAGRSEK